MISSIVRISLRHVPARRRARLAHAAQTHRDHLRIEPTAGLADQFGGNRLRLERQHHTERHQPIVHVGHGQDPRRHRYRAAAQSQRPARSIRPFAEGSDDCRRRREERHSAQRIASGENLAEWQGGLAWSEDVGRIGHGDLPKLVCERGALELTQVLVGQPQTGAHPKRHQGDALHVRQHIRRRAVQRRQQSQQRCRRAHPALDQRRNQPALPRNGLPRSQCRALNPGTHQTTRKSALAAAP